nr:MAG TPA: hypothetical protein [Caudoviricetes sp.]
MSTIFLKKNKKILKNPQTPLKQRHKTILIKNKKRLKIDCRRSFFTKNVIKKYNKLFCFFYKMCCKKTKKMILINK